MKYGDDPTGVRRYRKRKPFPGSGVAEAGSAEQYRRFHVRHITDRMEITRIQEESNYLPPNLRAPKPVHNLKNWDWYWPHPRLR
jgi:hypothetical protein